ncbi:MAG: hypothetical protein AAF515_06935 [Pseudomonadota bacterium]
MDVITAVRLTTPEPDLPTLSICGNDSRALAEWVMGLPLANTQLTADRLVIATEEIARVQVSAETRLELLETIRATLEYICSRLDNSASNSEAGEDRSKIAQRLQTNLTVGYKAVVRDANPAKDSEREIIPIACHRTMSGLSQTLLRSCQHYVAPSVNLWLELNQIFKVAEQMEFADIKFEDPETEAPVALSLSELYRRTLLLACAKPNQLRSRQLTQVYNALESWVAETKLTDDADAALFCIDLDKDEPPRYTRLVKERSAPSLRGLQTSVLVYELEAFVRGDDHRVAIPENFEIPMVNHLAACWGEIAKRSFRRAPASGPMKVALGMRAAHYFISGGVSFANQLSGADALIKREINPFMPFKLDTPAETALDPWARRIPENPNIIEPEKILVDANKTEEVSEDLSIYDTEIVDTSPGGYRIAWKSETPSNLQAGDIMAVREAEDERWCISVLRWVRHLDGETQTGLELMAPRAIPVAIRVIKKKGGLSDYSRALLLPDMAAIRQPATLIAPAILFQEQQKIHLQRQGIQATAQLQEERLRTETFIQFTFRMLDGYLENSSIDLNIEAPRDVSGSSATAEN